MRRYSGPEYREPVLLPRRSSGPASDPADQRRSTPVRYHVSPQSARQDDEDVGSNQIPGIGPARRKALIKHFGSVERIKSATRDELAATPTITKAAAEAIYVFFQNARIGGFETTDDKLLCYRNKSGFVALAGRDGVITHSSLPKATREEALAAIEAGLDAGQRRRCCCVRRFAGQAQEIFRGRAGRLLQRAGRCKQAWAVSCCRASGGTKDTLRNHSNLSAACRHGRFRASRKSGGKRNGR